MDPLVSFFLIILAIFIFLIVKMLITFFRDPINFLQRPKQQVKLSLSEYILFTILPLVIIFNLALPAIGYSSWLLILNPFLLGYLFTSALYLWISKVISGIGWLFITPALTALLWWLAQQANLLPQFAADYQTIYGYFGMGLALLERLFFKLQHPETKRLNFSK